MTLMLWKEIATTFETCAAGWMITLVKKHWVVGRNQRECTFQKCWIEYTFEGFKWESQVGNSTGVSELTPKKKNTMHRVWDYWWLLQSPNWVRCYYVLSVKCPLWAHVLIHLPFSWWRCLGRLVEPCLEEVSHWRYTLRFKSLDLLPASQLFTVWPTVLFLQPLFPHHSGLCP